MSKDRHEISSYGREMLREQARWDQLNGGCVPIDKINFPEFPDFSENKKGALSSQEGGNHYTKLKIQPVEYIQANDLDFFQGNVIKYVTRHKDKNGAGDIKKAIHFLQLYLELYYGQKQKDQGIGT